MKLARQMCDEWPLGFEDFSPCLVSDVIALSERLQDHPSLGVSEEAEGRNLLDKLRPHMYSWTPMRTAIGKALAAFRNHTDIEHLALIVIFDGNSTDGTHCHEWPS